MWDRSLKLNALWPTGMAVRLKDEGAVSHRESATSVVSRNTGYIDVKDTASFGQGI